MNRRTLWILLLLVAGAALGYFLFRPAPPAPPATVQAAPPPPAAPPAALPPTAPAPALTSPAPLAAAIPGATPSPTPPAPVAPPAVPIEDRKTIDFSSGQPVVKDSPEEQAIIDAAAKEMAEAARGVTIAPVRAPAKSSAAGVPAPAPAKN